ncbi:MAG: hypothetical protein R6W93_06730 [Candidatus Limnocylindrales bacterium]
MASRPRHIGSALLIAALLLGTEPIAQPVDVSASTRSAASPRPAAATAKWAWVVSRKLSGSWIPARHDRGNSSGDANTVTHQGSPGWYIVALPSAAPGGGETGSVLVSTLGTQPRICAPGGWDLVGGQVNVTVRCFTLSGTPANATFVMNWLTATGTGGRLAYAHNFSPTSNCGSPQQAYASRGGSISNCPITDDAALFDAARLRIPGLASNRGSVQVSAASQRATDPNVVSAGVCDLVRFYPARDLTNDADFADHEWVDLRCYEPDGDTEVYRRHYVWFMEGLGMKGIVRKNVAYLFASKPTASSYAPDRRHRYSSAGTAGRVSRLGTGSYVATLPGMPLGGSAQVTALGKQARHCVVTSIERTALPQRVGVRCFDLSGQRRDTKFTLAYAR